MRRQSAIFVLLAAPFAAAASPAAGTAQNTVIVKRSPQAAWLGVSYDVHWTAGEGTCSPRVVVETVVPGAPADRAGLRPGDAILSLNDEAVGATRLQLMSSRLAPGDSVRLRVVRSGGVRDMLAIADVRPDRPPTGFRVRGRSGFEASGAPVVRFDGDTLVVRNLEAAGTVRTRGYWVAYDDGRADYRRLDRFSGDAMDRRVANLVLCAASTQASAPTPRPVRVDMHALQVRADSLREVLAKRALTREEAEHRLRLLPARPPAYAPPSPHPGPLPELEGRTAVFTYSISDHVAAGERGVAGAEIASLEPELAEYFRGATDGLLVLRVAPGSPAERAGLRPGDVITTGAGRSLDSVGELRLLLALPDPTPVELRVIRHGRSRMLTIRRE